MLSRFERMTSFHNFRHLVVIPVGRRHVVRRAGVVTRAAAVVVELVVVQLVLAVGRLSRVC